MSGTSQIRELNAGELEMVSGGLDPLSILVGGAVAIFGMLVGDGIVNGTPVHGICNGGICMDFRTGSVTAGGHPL
jgi:lactobin A/cerein 7B family class IIb bacteriocin